MSESVFGQVDEATLLARMNAVVDEDEGGQTVSASGPEASASLGQGAAAGQPGGQAPGPDDPFAFILTGPPQG